MQKKILNNKNKKTILITGGAGYLGINLYYKFKDLYKIILIDNFTTNVVEMKKLENTKIFEIDINNFKELKFIFEKFKPNIVIHSAASYSDPNNWHRDVQTNTFGIINLINLSKISNVEKFIYFQSSNCYGETNKKKIEENDPCKPTSSYAISKTSAELYLKLSNIAFISQRLCIIYGPWHFSGPIPTFYKNLLKKKKSIITHSNRQFLYMDDFLNLISLILKQKLKNRRIYNVSSNDKISMIELFKKINNKLNVKNLNYEMKSVSVQDIKSVPLDNSLIKKDYNWEPSVSIDNGLNNLIEWYKSNFVGRSFSHLKIN